MPNVSKKFDPRDQEEKLLENQNENKDAQQQGATNDQATQVQVPTDVLKLISQLTAQVTELTKELHAVKSDHTKLSDNVDDFKRETEEQRMKSFEKVEKQRMSKQEIIKRKWAADPKVSLLVPLEGKEKVGARLHVQVQGYVYVHTDGLPGVPKAKYCEVPKGVADIVMESLSQSIENVGTDVRLDTRQLTAEGAKFDPTRLER